MKRMLSLILSSILLTSPALAAEEKNEQTPKKKYNWLKPLMYCTATAAIILALAKMLTDKKSNSGSSADAGKKDDEIVWQSTNFTAGGSDFEHTTQRKSKNGPILKETFRVNNRVVSREEFDALAKLALHADGFKVF